VPVSWDALAPDSREQLYAWPQQPWVRLNMVINAEGKTKGCDGSSHSITSTHDRELVRFVRRDADAVIEGAASVRAEGWFLPPRGDLLVVTRSNELPPGAPDRTRVLATTLENLEHALIGKQHVLCEGGRTVATHLNEAGMIDELLLTFEAASDAQIELPEWLANGAITWTCETDIADGTHRFTIWRRGIK